MICTMPINRGLITTSPQRAIASASLLFLAIVLLAPCARAGGGAHVVDDATVEVPGTCHLESWVTRNDPRRGLVNLSPACTREAWPSLEIGASLQHAWDGNRSTSVGPALKLNLRPVERGMGLALAVAGAWNLDTGRFETASIIVPVTMPVNELLRININGGWIYSHADAHRHAAFFGGQVEAQLASDVSAMAEIFGRDRGRAAGQIGLRWNPSAGPVDIDLLGGRRIDGTSPSAVTLGFTIRH